MLKQQQATERQSRVVCLGPQALLLPGQELPLLQLRATTMAMMITELGTVPRGERGTPPLPQQRAHTDLMIVSSLLCVAMVLLTIITERQNVNYCDDPSSDGFTAISSGAQANQKKMLIAHGTLAALAFVIFFPAGSIAIRLASFPGIIWFHAAFQVFAYLVYIAAFGLGVYIASQLDLVSAEIHDYLYEHN